MGRLDKARELLQEVFGKGQEHVRAFDDVGLSRAQYGDSASVETVATDDGSEAAEQYARREQALDEARKALLGACDGYFSCVPTRPPADHPDYTAHRAVSKIAGMARQQTDIGSDLEDLRRFLVVPTAPGRSLTMTVEELREEITATGLNKVPARPTVQGWIAAARKSGKHVSEWPNPAGKSKLYERGFLRALARKHDYL